MCRWKALLSARQCLGACSTEQRHLDQAVIGSVREAEQTLLLSSHSLVNLMGVPVSVRRWSGGRSVWQEGVAGAAPAYTTTVAADGPSSWCHLLIGSLCPQPPPLPCPCGGQGPSLSFRMDLGCLGKEGGRRRLFAATTSL